MLDEVTKYSESRQYYAVLRRHHWFSSYMWLEQEIDDRIALGELVKAAAFALEDSNAEAAALIDDLGWSKVTKRDYVGARDCIDAGLTAAQRPGVDKYWVAKAHRHIAAIDIETGNYDQAKVELAKSLDEAQGILVQTGKKEMLRKIYFGHALCASRENLWDETIKWLDVSENYVEVPPEPSTFALRGLAHLRKGEMARAEAVFRRGLAISEAQGNRPEAARNLEGLLEYSVMHGSGQVEIDRLRHQIATIRNETPIPYELSDKGLTS